MSVHRSTHPSSFVCIWIVVASAIAISPWGTALAESLALTPAVSHSIVSELDTLLARPSGLKANDVAERAIATSFSLLEKLEEVNAASAQVDQARLAWLPRLGFTGRFARLSPVNPEPIGNVVVSATGQVGLLPSGSPLASVPFVINQPLFTTQLTGIVTLPLSDYLARIPALNSAANASRSAAMLTARAVKLQVAADARIVYYAWVKARLQTAVATQAVERAQQHRDRAQRAFKTGVASRVDLLRLETQLASAEQFLVKAQNLEAVLDDQLRTVMHASPDEPFEIGEDLRAALPPLKVPRITDLLEEAYSERLEIRAVSSAVRAKRAQAGVARSTGVPSIALFGEVTQANPNLRFFPPTQQFNSSWSVGAAVSYTLNDTLVAHAAGREASARARALEHQLGGLKDQLRIEVARAVEQVRDADSSIAAANRGLEAAEAALRSREDQYQQGRSTHIELTDAEAEATQAGLSFITARVDQRLGRARLRHALGRDVSEELRR